MKEAAFNLVAPYLQRPALGPRVRSVTITPDAQGGVSGKTFRRDGAAAGLPGTMYTHGGGFTIGSTTSHRALIARLARTRDHDRMVLLSPLSGMARMATGAVAKGAGDVQLTVHENVAHVGQMNPERSRAANISLDALGAFSRCET